MRKLAMVLMVAGFVVGLSFTNAMAIPTINGTVVAGEWNNPIVHVYDGAEAGIPDNWDIKELFIIQENSGGAGDGLYFRIDVYGSPTTAGEDGVSGNEAYSYSWMDYDNNGSIDDNIEANFLGGDEIRVNGSVVALGQLGVGPNAWEFFVPEASLSALSLPGLTNSFRGLTHLDGHGGSQDDDIPNSGRYTVVPEPGSVSLLGLSLLGLVGSIFRRKFMA